MQQEVTAGEGRRRAPFVAAIVGLALTAALGITIAQSVERERALDLAARANAAGFDLRQQLDSYQDLLRSIEGFYAGSDNVTADEFRAYVTAYEVQRRLPGVRAIEVATKEIVDGREAYIVSLIEPRAGNEAAIGLDLAFEPTRREAVERARDQGEVVATAPLELVQGGDGAALLLIAPLYDTETGEIPRTGPARRRAFEGITLAVIEVPQLIAGAFDRPPAIDYELYDLGLTTRAPGEVVEAASLFDPDDVAGEYASGGDVGVDLNVGGRRWRLNATWPDDEPIAPLLGPNTTAVAAGLAITGAIVWLLGNADRRRRDAEALAREMTAELDARQRELAAANEALLDQRTRLEMANARLKRFAAMAAHDLRTPLTTIIGMSEHLLMILEHLDAEERDLFERIPHAGHRLNGMIGEMLDSALSATDDVTETADVAEVVRVTLATLHDWIDEVDGDIEVASDLPVVAADPAQVRMILQNLITNSIRYRAPDRPPRVRISAREHGEGIVAITVEDAGRGIAPENREAVFDRGERLDAVATGSGLGLAAVREAVIAADGDIWAHDGDLGGVAFTFTLPAHEPAPRTESPGVDGGPTNGLLTQRN